MLTRADWTLTVSYTHLDVDKRQTKKKAAPKKAAKKAAPKKAAKKAAPKKAAKKAAKKKK